MPQRYNKSGENVRTTVGKAMNEMKMYRILSLAVYGKMTHKPIIAVNCIFLNILIYKDYSGFLKRPSFEALTHEKN